MRHLNKTKKLDRSHSARQALWKSQVISLVMHKSITTTTAKAKALKPLVEQYITRAKTNTIANRRLLTQRIGSEKAVKELLDKIAPSMKTRAGGYTRIIPLAKRRAGDAAPVVKLEILL